MRLIEDFNAIPSLGFLTGSRIVIMIWNRRDITRSIGACLNIDNEPTFYGMWEEIESNVRLNIQSIEGLPGSLLDQIKSINAPISIQIMAIRTFGHFAPIAANAVLEFPISYWTPYGTVDTERHEELIAQMHRNDIGFRYNLACNDCFVEIIDDLFPLLTDVQKNNFLRMDRNRELLSYWTHRKSHILPSFRNLISEHDYMEDRDYSVDQFAFLYTMLTGNKSGIKYFLSYLTREQYESVITNDVHLVLEEYIDRKIFTFEMNARPHMHFEDSMYFLMSKLRDEKQMEILRRYPYNILRIFLKYPFFGIFSKCARRLIQETQDFRWQYVSLILFDIYVLEKLNTNLFGLELFNDLWHMCPPSIKADIKDSRENVVFHVESDFLSLLERIAEAEK